MEARIVCIGIGDSEEELTQLSLCRKTICLLLPVLDWAMLPASLSCDSFFGLSGNTVGYLFGICLPLVGRNFCPAPLPAVFLPWVLCREFPCAVFRGIPYKDCYNHPLQPYAASMRKAEPPLPALPPIPRERLYSGFCGKPGNSFSLYS